MTFSNYAVYPLWPDEVEKVDNITFAKLRAIHYAGKYGVPIAVKMLPYTPRLADKNGTLEFYIDSMGRKTHKIPKSPVALAGQ